MTTFYKWAGGKRRLLPHILPRLPEDHPYVEPFFGGGAVFFAYAAREEAAGRIVVGVLNDANPHVVATLRAVQQDPDDVIARFNQHAVRERADARAYYYDVREQKFNALHPSLLTAAAARFLYMNKAGFNGLWRENRAGGNNVPFGDGKPVTLDADAVRSASRQLAGMEITHGDFSKVRPPPNATIYCDPPYLPASATANFSGYTAGGFGGGDHLRLAQWCADRCASGATVILSSAGTGEALQATAKLASEVIPLTAPRVISCKGAERLAVPEYLFVFNPARSATPCT